MPIIRPISDLRNRATEISDICHHEDEPIFITKNGKSDMVVMSQTHFDRIQSLFELYQKLGEAELLDASGDEGISHKNLMSSLRKKLR
ncbi:MAG: type II toxin-antitoxin system Phd/YefM family antitoxin [Deltaproteobacteria bacterium]|nr:type II toxin-antitoxin system Phd/YefM family antitoxin [Deltaproteobacteria bacterium]MBW2178141.1 type II toxin-antitoxin system Phd/YefM family antitoxin [Deltaproteobacteria bacterium]MBW2612720.1 type II toxin-antitoxin system Phd/YefM family antitoxin [Deltaproteobacteria bacterium]MBW2678320.1 type II toxin-antitoxin system Phd/YefM family antitoxin [Deltaproteobacteria bacterium]